MENARWCFVMFAFGSKISMEISMTHQTEMFDKKTKKAHSLSQKYLIVMIKFQWYVFVWRCKVIAINSTVCNEVEIDI
jgi:hypothetical protein